jgi:acetyl esterase/lipase
MPRVWFFSLALLALVIPCPARAEAPPGKFAVEAVKDVAYYDGPGAHKTKHRLDLYLPRGQKDFPVLFFVHGGAWMRGDKAMLGLYGVLGSFYARHGVGAVVINYRLSPGVQHPEHVKDVARAFAWTHKNVKKYGGRPDQLFVCGHSAGGHLAALLATDGTYLKAEGLSLKDVRGAMPISGVYALVGNLFQEAFGTDREVRRQAGPRNQVREGCPPFLIVYADQDFPFCDLGSEDFCKALQAKKVEARTLKVAGRNHIDVLTRIPRDGDPCARALVEFVTAHTGR